MELWFTERHTPNVKFSIKVDRQLYTGQSEFQRIDVFDSKEFGRFLTLVKGELAVGSLPFLASDLLPQDALLKEIWSPFPLPWASQVAQ